MFCCSLAPVGKVRVANTKTAAVAAAAAASAAAAAAATPAASAAAAAARTSFHVCGFKYKHNLFSLLSSSLFPLLLLFLTLPTRHVLRGSLIK